MPVIDLQRVTRNGHAGQIHDAGLTLSGVHVRLTSHSAVNLWSLNGLYPPTISGGGCERQR